MATSRRAALYVRVSTNDRGQTVEDQTLIDILVTDCRPQCRSLIAMQSHIWTSTAWQDRR